jgi:hypothetical protein
MGLAGGPCTKKISSPACICRILFPRKNSISSRVCHGDNCRGLSGGRLELGISSTDDDDAYAVATRPFTSAYSAFIAAA